MHNVQVWSGQQPSGGNYMGLNCVNFVIISLEELYVSFFFYL